MQGYEAAHYCTPSSLVNCFSGRFYIVLTAISFAGRQHHAPQDCDDTQLAYDAYEQKQGGNTIKTLYDAWRTDTDVSHFTGNLTPAYNPNRCEPQRACKCLTRHHSMHAPRAQSQARPSNEARSSSGREMPHGEIAVDPIQRHYLKPSIEAYLPEGIQPRHPSGMKGASDTEEPDIHRTIVTVMDEGLSAIREAKKVVKETRDTSLTDVSVVSRDTDMASKAGSQALVELDMFQKEGYNTEIAKSMLLNERNSLLKECIEICDMVQKNLEKQKEDLYQYNGLDETQDTEGQAKLKQRRRAKRFIQYQMAADEQSRRKAFCRDQMENQGHETSDSQAHSSRSKFSSRSLSDSSALLDKHTFLTSGNRETEDPKRFHCTMLGDAEIDYHDLCQRMTDAKKTATLNEQIQEQREGCLANPEKYKLLPVLAP